MPEWIEITLSIVVATILVSPILGPAIYFACIREPLYNYRERKCRRLYSEYFVILDARDRLQNNELREARYRENSARQDIDLINKEMPYTPLEDMSAKQMEIEVLKKEKAKAKADVKKYGEIINEYNCKMREMRQDNKQLTKLYNMNW